MQCLERALQNLLLARITRSEFRTWLSAQAPSRQGWSRQGHPTTSGRVLSNFKENYQRLENHVPRRLFGPLAKLLISFPATFKMGSGNKKPRAVRGRILLHIYFTKRSHSSPVPQTKSVLQNQTVVIPLLSRNFFRSISCWIHTYFFKFHISRHSIIQGSYVDI